MLVVRDRLGFKTVQLKGLKSYRKYSGIFVYFKFSEIKIKKTLTDNWCGLPHTLRMPLIR